MILAEAKNYFPFSEEDELEELYLERLFEFKQFFSQKTPISNVFNAKLLKLVKMEEAYEVISELSSDKRTLPIEKQVFRNLEVHFSSDILLSFNEFELQKGIFKIDVLSVTNSYELNEIVMNWLKVVHNYQQNWSKACDFDIDIESISKEPNPMDLLSEIRAFNEQGGKTFADISKLKSNEFLMKEMKRVSLLLEKTNQ